MQKHASAVALVLALRCFCSSGAALADRRREGVAVPDDPSHGQAPRAEKRGEEERRRVEEEARRRQEPEAINGTQAVTRVRSLQGPDFTKGDTAWRTRLAAMNERRPDIFSKNPVMTHEDATALAAAAPLTALYVLAKNHGRLFPDGTVPNPLRVHVLGAAYTFEGRGDWRLLAEAMPPGVSLEVSLIVGTPREADGVQEMRRVSLFKDEVCREHGTFKVRCIESYHQDVMSTLERPHLAMMFNPGFPQVYRRTWDKSLLFLLRERIPTAVSAQVSNKKSWPEPDGPWDSSFNLESTSPPWENEDFPIDATLKAYGADVWSTTGSPFYIKSPRCAEMPDGVTFIKNGVIELFRGLRPGTALRPAPAAVPREDVEFLNKFDWRSAEKIMDDDKMHIDMRSALMTPVSEGFERAADSVYLRFLQYWLYKKRMEPLHDFSLRGRRTEVQGKLKDMMSRMKRMEPIKARDWIFLKTTTGID